MSGGGRMLRVIAALLLTTGCPCFFGDCPPRPPKSPTRASCCGYDAGACEDAPVCRGEFWGEITWAAIWDAPPLPTACFDPAPPACTVPEGLGPGLWMWCAVTAPTSLHPRPEPPSDAVTLLPGDSFYRDRPTSRGVRARAQEEVR